MIFLENNGHLAFHVGPPLVASRLTYILLQSIRTCRDENGFGIFRNSENRFRFFSVGFIGIGIFRKRYRLSEFRFGIGIGIGTTFYRPFPLVTDFNQNFTGFSYRNFRKYQSTFDIPAQSSVSSAHQKRPIAALPTCLVLSPRAKLAVGFVAAPRRAIAKGQALWRRTAAAARAGQRATHPAILLVQSSGQVSRDSQLPASCLLLPHPARRQWNGSVCLPSAATSSRVMGVCLSHLLLSIITSL